jgi:hypothetical protein
MTLDDALHAYTARLHRKALRPHLGWRVVNPDNDLRLASSLRDERKGCGSDPRPQPTIFQTVSHAALHTGETA